MKRKDRRRAARGAPYNEQYAAWHMFKGGPAVVVGATTVTRASMIKFGTS